MNKAEIIERLQKIAWHVAHTIGEDPFIMSLDDGIALLEAVTLLKEQRAKPPRMHENAYGNKFYYCPKCNRAFDYFNQESYCHDCGQEVKWNDVALVQTD